MDNPVDSNLPPTPPPPPSSGVPPLIRPVALAPIRPRKSRGWMIIALVLFCLLALSVFTNLSQWLGNVVPVSAGLQRKAGPQLEEVLVEHHNSNHKIVVIPVEGLIMNEGLGRSPFSMVQIIRDQLEQAASDHRVKAVLLRVNSPGGEVLASDEIYRAVLDFQKRSQKPVVASMGSLAASGGYYVAAGSQWIVANELTITGSIGVIMQGWNYRNLMDKVGVRPEVFKSGRFKDMMSGARRESDITQDERDMVQALVNQTFERFKEVIAEGRRFAQERNKNQNEKGRLLSPDWEEYADGRILSGKEAVKFGFVDELGNQQAALARARKLARIESANVVEYREVVNFSDLFRLFGRSEGNAVKLELGPAELARIRSGQLYFLSPTFAR